MSKRKFTFEDWQRMEVFQGAYLSDDGKSLIYKVNRYNEEFGRKERLTFIKDLESGKETKLAGDRKDEVLKEIHQPVMESLLSPDGKKLLFASPSAGSTPPDPEEPVVIEHLNYKFDGAGFYTPDSYMHLWVYDIESKSLECITDGEFNFMHPNWMPDSRTVICGSGCFAKTNNPLAMDLVLIDIESKERKRLTSERWMVSYPNPLRPVPSQDGKYVYAGFFAQQPDESKDDGEQSYPDIWLYRVNADGSGMEKIFEPSENCFQCVQFPYNPGCGYSMDSLKLSEDGKYLYFFAGFNGAGTLYRLSTDGGKAETILTGKKIFRGISDFKNGKAVVGCSEPDVPESYYLLDTNNGNSLTKVLQSNRALLDNVSFGKAEDFTFDCLDGDGFVHGWVLEPADRKEGQKYPAILYIHGGPHPFYTYGFTPELQCLAAEGFAVLYCNPRGSSGYGAEHQDIKKAMGNEAYTDVLQFTDEACRRFAFIDPERIGATGGSYGGYMTNYLATHSKRYKAYVTQRSVASNLISYATSDMSGSSKRYEHFEEFMLRELEKSAVCYADNVDKPFLILQGEEDLRTPVEGAHQLFTAIKDCHPEIPCKLVIYPHTAHDQPEIPKLHRHYYDEMVSWFKEYL